MKSFIHFDDMTWPNPLDPLEIEWKLCYAPDRETQIVAASYIAAYKQLISDTQKSRNYKCQKIKELMNG